MHFNKSKIKKILIPGVLLFLAIACKSDYFDVIPNVYFNVYLSANEVLSIGTGSVITKDGGGVKGLIIYKLSETEFQAFDRLCTNYPLDTAAVVIDKVSMTATCPKCKSVFQINLYGQVNKGPAKYALKQYQTALVGGRLDIWN